MSHIGLLTATIGLPLLGAILLMFVPAQYGSWIKWLNIIFSVLTFGASLAVLAQFNSDTFHFQMVEFIPWLPQFGINFKVGVDGISIWLFVLSTLIMLLSSVFSFYIKDRTKTFFIMMLILETAMLGVFTSLDIFLFYCFFEASLIPMAVMIYIWGGQERNYAAIKFFIFTFAASIFMLIGMVVLVNHYSKVTGNPVTFDLIALQSAVASGQMWIGSFQLQAILFWSFAVAMIVKCPMFPVHTWLPDAHTQAPTAGSMILAGVLLKMGTYGLLRFCLPLFPDATKDAVPVIMGLAVVGIIYGAVMAAVQNDLKKLVAFSSVAHMGFVVYGIFSLQHVGMMGGAYQQLNHGISTGALFLLIGLLYERIHTREFKDMGGLKKQMPIFAALFLIVMLSSVGLPGLNGFVGEFMALMGGFMASSVNQGELPMMLPIIACTGVILAAVYLLWMFQKVFYGPVTNPTLLRLKDLKPWEIGLVGVFIVFIFWGGLYPNTFLKPMEKSISAVRMMVKNPPSMRPMWSDPSMEIADDGAFVQDGRVISGANYYEPASRTVETNLGAE